VYRQCNLSRTEPQLGNALYSRMSAKDDAGHRRASKLALPDCARAALHFRVGLCSPLNPSRPASTPPPVLLVHIECPRPFPLEPITSIVRWETIPTPIQPRHRTQKRVPSRTTTSFTIHTIPMSTHPLRRVNHGAIRLWKSLR